MSTPAASVFDEVRNESQPAGQKKTNGNVFDEVRVTKPSQEETEPEASWTGAIKGVGDAALTIGSGGLRALTHSVNDLLPESVAGGPGSRAAMERDIQSDPILNYQPKTPEGEYLMGWIKKLTSPASWAANTAHDVISRNFGERAADVTGDITNIGLARLGGSRLGPEGEAAPIETGHPLTDIAKGEVSRLSAFTERAKQIGLDLPEGGTADRHATAALNNRPLVNDVARQDLQLPKNAPLTPEMLDQARTAYVSPAYKAITNLKDPIPLDQGFRDNINNLVKTTRGEFNPKLVPPQGSQISGAEAVEFSQSARYRARVLDKRASMGDPEAAAEAQLYRRSAEAVEDAVQSHLESTGQGALSKAWDDARVYAAKSHSYEDALDGAGNVQSSNLKKQLFTKNKPLAGDQEMLANLAAQYPESFRTTRITQPQAGVMRKTLAEAAPVVGGTVGAWTGGPLGAAAGTAVGKGAATRILKR